MMMMMMLMDLTLFQSSVWAREEQKKEKRNKEKGDDPYYFGLSARFSYILTILDSLQGFPTILAFLHGFLTKLFRF